MNYKWDGLFDADEYTIIGRSMKTPSLEQDAEIALSQSK